MVSGSGSGQPSQGLQGGGTKGSLDFGHLLVASHKLAQVRESPAWAP